MIFISWGFPFLKGGGEKSLEMMYSISRNKTSLKKSKNPNIIISPKFCLSKKNIRSEDSFFYIRYLPVLVIYWSTCFDKNFILRFFKIILKWGSLTLFEILAAFYALIFFPSQKKYISSDLYITAFIISIFKGPSKTYLRLHGAPKTIIQKLVCSLSSNKLTILNNGNYISDRKNIINYEMPIPEYFNFSEQQILNKWSTKTYTLAYIGRAEYVKGFDLIVNYLNSIKSKIKIKDVYIISEGEMIKSHLNRIKEIQDIKYFNSLPRKMIAEKLKNIHFLILPSRKDFAPNVIKEALSMGTIVICAEVLENYLKNKFNSKNIFSIDRFKKTTFKIESNKYKEKESLIINILRDV